MVYKVLFLFFPLFAFSQQLIRGVVIDGFTKEKLKNVEVYDAKKGLLTTTNLNGEFSFSINSSAELVFISDKHETLNLNIDDKTQELKVELVPLKKVLNEVVISNKAKERFDLKRLADVEGTAIYAGKKTEAILLEQMQANLSSNNAREVYSQIVGLNIYDSNDGGLQLNIGGRGLDPNRTSNFNTRQNGYDISADVLGYPESYYTPPTEGLKEIQIIRGAASLQYGTQFGGLLNFVMKEPNEKKKIELISRNTIGSNNFYSSFNSLSGKVNKFSYYTYFNYKKGDGFRPNSDFDSKNLYTHLAYDFNDKTKLALEYTHLNYLAKQAGGMSDEQFNLNPDFSNRTRNYFKVDWNLFALKYTHDFNEKSKLSINTFGLLAQRNALGFRGNQVNLNANPVTDEDEKELDGSFSYTRDLIKGKFKNFGIEARFLTDYKIKNKKSTFLIGSKFYQAKNSAIQGAGKNDTSADFSLQNDSYPDYPNQSDFIFPNQNIALFSENIFYLSDKFTITPGIRFEYIKTESEGTFRENYYDRAGNLLSFRVEQDNRVFNRNILLLGIGTSWKPNKNIEVFGNISQNYRSVTFSDIRVVNTSFQINPTISDEKGFTFDVGARGKYKKYLSYDTGIFGLYYDNRIGNLTESNDSRLINIRGNVGTAFIYGIESFFDWNVWETFFTNRNYKLNLYANTTFTQSEYIKSQENGVEGRKVEFIPDVNLKTGIKFGYKNLLGSFQFTHLSEQFTDAQNSPSEENNGRVGEIPAYSVADISLSYKLNKTFKVESGINNLFDEKYFTRRATGYPGPGIIPSAPRTFYVTLEVKL
ncbi:MAG: TonB-dependent receptor [Flavobacteriales bacterium]|nr:TonB-dependent receptor [Flavobacteriales bacterium]